MGDAPDVPPHPDSAYRGKDRWGEHVGMEIIEASPGRMRARVVAREDHHQPYGILHGGVYCSIVEGLASYGAGLSARARGTGVGVVGVSNQTDFLRSHSEGVLLAEALPVHLGRRTQLWEVSIRRESDGKPVALGKVRFQVLDVLPGQRHKRLASEDSR